MNQIVRQDPRLSVQTIGEAANIDKATAWKRLVEDLDMKEFYAKTVPRSLTRRTPVSYTHLDVYKRQTSRPTLNPPTPHL